jgi:Holliday junction resolvase RusA-like endonuclease
VAAGEDAVVSVRITLLIVPPSGSVYTREHWAVKRELRKRFGWVMLMEQRLQMPTLPPAEGKRAVKITIHRNRPLDKDNLYSGCKPMIDAMRDIRLIKNDSPKWIELSVSQEACHRGQERTEIEVSEIAISPKGLK